MTITVLGALLLTALLAFVSRTVTGFGDAARAAEEAVDEQARVELLALGWQPPGSGALRALHAELAVSRGVELLHVGQRFRIELGDRTLRGEPADEAPLAAATVLLADELTLYPPAFLRRIGLRRVALCGGLSENGLPIPSLPNYRHTLLIDVAGEPAFLRRLVHHEVFHFADLADDGEVLWDPQWDRLNPPDFEYGHGGRDMRQPGVSALSDDLPGFLTRYATSALEEDKAEVFAFLMARPGEVERRAARDTVLAGKVARVRAIVLGLDPAMDATFWARVAESRSR